jgi:3D-(3,5/4)-trihydroxycyclohexane-1,2-dione acylhydrolase (decyclizing)
VLPLDFVANAHSLGVKAWRADSIDALTAALAAARSVPGPVLIEIEADPLVPSPDSGSWWDVPVAEVSHLDATLEARKSYQEKKAHQRHYL